MRKIQYTSKGTCLSFYLCAEESGRHDSSSGNRILPAEIRALFCPKLPRWGSLRSVWPSDTLFRKHIPCGQFIIGRKRSPQNLNCSGKCWRNTQMSFLRPHLEATERFQRTPGSVGSQPSRHAWQRVPPSLLLCLRTERGESLRVSDPLCPQQA